MNDPFFSLIVATAGENGDLERLFASFVEQRFRDFEVIVVDQNEDGRLTCTIEKYIPHLNVRRIACMPGLSKARNRGRLEARAPILGFPDDDCWYEAGFLERLASIFREQLDCVGVTGLCLDERNRPAAGGGSRRPGDITKRNVWSRGVSTTLFLRRSVIDKVGGFDELLGLGAPTLYQSAEETDLMLRMIAGGNRIIYRPDLVVRHPTFRRDGARAVEKAWQYGLGMGRVLRTHSYPVADVLAHLARPAMGAVVAFCTLQPDLARVRWARAVGRLRGYVAAPNRVNCNGRP